MDDQTIETAPEFRVILRQKCTVCTGEIMMQIFLNTGVCCENCRKIRDGEKPKETY